MTTQPKVNNRRLYWLVGQLKLPEDILEGLVIQFTNERGKSTKDLTQRESNAISGYLNTLLQEKNGKQAPPKKTWTPRDPLANKMRMKVIALCHNMKMQIPGTTSIDMKRVDALCIERGHAHKKLDDYSREELVTLITQVEKMVRDFLNARS